MPIELIVDTHKKDDFFCGIPILDEYLIRFVGQHTKKNISRTYVATGDSSDRQILGYYTIAASSVELDRFPDAARRKLPRHPIPCLVLGRLAVDMRVQGQGLGRVLLFHAFRTCRQLADRIGIFGLQVHAIDDKAKAFYEKYGFAAFPNHPLNLFFATESIGSFLSSPGDPS